MPSSEQPSEAGDDHGPGKLAERAREQAIAQRRRYSRGADRPLGGYAGLLAAYAVVQAAGAALMRRSGRTLPERFDARDLALITVATHKVARLLAKDPVTSPLRAPFTRYEGLSGESELAEDVRGSGARKAVGELLTCPFCLGHWVATGFVWGLVVAPRATRFVASIFTVLSGSDVLQFAYSAIQEHEIS